MRNLHAKPETRVGTECSRTSCKTLAKDSLVQTFYPSECLAFDRCYIRIETDHLASLYVLCSEVIVENVLWWNSE